MFVVDDLAAWLVELVADACRGRLASWVLGGEQERALRAAAADAVRLTAEELHPADAERAAQLAMVIDHVFSVPVVRPKAGGSATLIQALQSGVARQVGVLGDPDLTGTGRSSAELLGVSAETLAEKLAGCLLREIVIRGAVGGALSPLADQLNHEVSHTQAQRIEGMVGHLSSQVREVFAELRSYQRPGDEESGGLPAGRLITELTDPFALEIHRPISVGFEPPSGGLPLLPPYIRREHDGKLAELVARAAAGLSAIGVLVGESSTGKTRACWEAIQALPSQWRVWHPIFPDRAKAFLAELRRVGPCTAVWLNEAQLYLLTANPRVGEQVADGVRVLLRDPARGPVLVLGTIWPGYWDQLTHRARGQDAADPHASARMLLEGTVIEVPDRFDGAALSALSAAAQHDRRLAEVAAQVANGQVTQLLAGAPALLERYRTAPATAKAVIHAAMDARRIGHGSAMPSTLLQAAAPGYLTDQQWEQAGEDWLEQALSYTAAPCNGVRGPVAPIRPRPAAVHVQQLVGSDTASSRRYQLADYLDQYARQYRSDQPPPAAFWDALVACADTTDLLALADGAQARGHMRHAALLRKRAFAAGDISAGYALVTRLPDDVPSIASDAAEWVAAHGGLADPRVATTVLQTLEGNGRHEAAARAAIQAAAQVALSDHPSTSKIRPVGAEKFVLDLDSAPSVIRGLIGALRASGGPAALAALAANSSAYRLTNLSSLVELLTAVRKECDSSSLATLATYAASHADLQSAWDISSLLEVLQEAGAKDAAATLLARDPGAHADLVAYPGGARRLMKMLLQAGDHQALDAFAARIAANAALDTHSLATLLQALREVGAQEAAAALAHRAAATTMAEHPCAVAKLLTTLREAGADHAIAVLADRATACDDLTNPSALAARIVLAREVSTHDSLTALADHAAAHADLTWQSGLPEEDGDFIDVPKSHPVAELLNALREARTDRAVTTLLARGPAAHTDLTNPHAVASLLKALAAAGDPDAVADLTQRAAAQAELFGSPYWNALDILHTAMTQAGATGPARALADRAAATVDIRSPRSVSAVLETLLKAGDPQSAYALLARDPAANADLSRPGDLNFLFNALEKAGAREAVAALANRAAAQVEITDLTGVAHLLAKLLSIGASEAVTTLLARNPAAHVRIYPDRSDWPSDTSSLAFALIDAGSVDSAESLIARAEKSGKMVRIRKGGIELPKEQYPFGREPDGRPALPWTWQHLA